MAQVTTSAESSEPIATAIANPAPLGLCAFALTTFVLSSINAGIIVPGVGIGTNVVVGLALFYGGVVQLLAGMWEFRAGNTFGGTAFSSYGGFWLAFGFIFIPGSGILDALVKSGTALHPALGLFLLGWTIFTGIMFLGALRSNISLLAVFGLLFLTFLALTIAELNGGNTSFTQIGGWLGILTAIAAWYAALAGLLSSARSFFTLPIGPLR